MNERFCAKVAQDDVLRGLHELGLREGAAVFVHSSLSRFGEIAGGAHAVIGALREVVGGRGTIIMPSFNMGIFGSSPTVLDVGTTPSEMGAVTEAFRTMRGVARTENLFHPVCVQGPLADVILQCQTEDTWGPGSPYDLYCRENVTVVLLGTNFYSTSLFHYCEQRHDVPYREAVVYEGFVVDTQGRRKPAACRRLRRKPGAESDFNVLYGLFDLATGLLGREGAAKVRLRETSIGTAICRSFEARTMVEVADTILQVDPRALQLTSALLTPMPTMVGEAAFSMTGCVRSLHTKNRTLVADGFGDSLQHIRDILPLRYHRYPSGSTAWTWTIPQRWDFRDAFVALESSGEKVIDASRCLLHLHIGSTPVDTVVTREELLAHLAYRDDLPDAIPYVTRYYDGGWGFSVRKANLEAIVGHAAGERFRVVVDTSLDDGVMLVGEVTVPGYGEATILFPIHLDHPWQCNDNLSGCAVAIELALRLGRVPDLRHSYRFLFVPETIGTIAFCARHPDVLKTVKYGIVVDSVGTAGPLRVMAARDAGSILNRYALAALRTVTPWQGDDALRHVGFYDYEHFVSANDERMLQVPGVDIPSVAISRYPFKEYHTDQDTPSIISEDKLEETLAVLMEMVRLIEEDFRPRQTYPGMLCLSAYGLYDASWSIEEKLSIEKTLYLLTGELSAFEIAEKVEAPFDFVAGFLRKLQAQALVEAV